MPEITAAQRLAVERREALAEPPSMDVYVDICTGRGRRRAASASATDLDITTSEVACFTQSEYVPLPPACVPLAA